jgi:hypothetical protein
MSVGDEDGRHRVRAKVAACELGEDRGGRGVVTGVHERHLTVRDRDDAHRHHSILDDANAVDLVAVRDRLTAEKGHRQQGDDRDDEDGEQQSHDLQRPFHAAHYMRGW